MNGCGERWPADHQLDPGQPVNTDTYQMTDDELAAAGVNRLPRNLGEATDAFEASELAKEVLGDEFHATFIKKKREEWLSYNTVVGGWERDMYLRLW